MKNTASFLAFGCLFLLVSFSVAAETGVVGRVFLKQEDKTSHLLITGGAAKELMRFLGKGSAIECSVVDLEGSEASCWVSVGETGEVSRAPERAAVKDAAITSLGSTWVHDEGDSKSVRLKLSGVVAETLLESFPGNHQNIRCLRQRVSSGKTFYRPLATLCRLAFTQEGTALVAEDVWGPLDESSGK